VGEKKDPFFFSAPERERDSNGQVFIQNLIDVGTLSIRSTLALNEINNDKKSKQPAVAAHTPLPQAQLCQFEISLTMASLKSRSLLGLVNARCRAY